MYSVESLSLLSNYSAVMSKGKIGGCELLAVGMWVKSYFFISTSVGTDRGVVVVVLWDREGKAVGRKFIVLFLSGEKKAVGGKFMEEPLFSVLLLSAM